MSNIFINRNRSQGAYTTPMIKQKFMSSDQTWFSRGEKAKQNKDTFYKNSLKFGANPDLQPKHVGMQWSIVDCCDTVKVNQDQMEERYNQTETSMPLYKAYNTFENPNQQYEQRLNQYPGPGSPQIHPSMQSNGFVNYANSGGISKKEDLRNQINSIAVRIAEAKKVKGVLCLNNGKPNGTSWKTPSLDHAFCSKQGFKGGETSQRFYTKFPVYRPRGHGAADVQDNIEKVWQEQITPLNSTKPNVLLDSRFRASSYSNAIDSQMKAQDPQLANILNDAEGSLRYKKNVGRSNSNTSQTKHHETSKSLKFAGRNTLSFPKRERFNEDTESVIAEQRATQATRLPGNNFTAANLQQRDIRSQAGSQVSYLSNRSMSKSELAKHFASRKLQQEEDVKSRISQISKGQGFKSRILRKLDDQPIGEMTQEASDAQLELLEKEEAPEQEDAATVATSQIDQVSVAPTEQLAQEYEKLIQQYEDEIQQRQELEQQVDQLKEGNQ